MKIIDFNKKIVLIYEIIFNSDIDKLLEEFYHKSTITGKERADRKKTIKNWIENKEMNSPKQFKYNEYSFKDKHYPDGTILFNEDDFINMPFEIFKSSLQKYILMTEKSLEFNYNYIYYFNTNIRDISYLELTMKKQLSHNKYEITLFEKTEGANYQIYNGTLEKVENYIYIFVENNFEKLSLNFMKNQGIEHSNQLYGLSMGKAYETGVPKASKAILTIEKLKEKEKKFTYFYLNETEILLADEAIQSTFDKQSYIKNFNRKINTLTTYMSSMRDLLSTTIKSDAYLSIFHKQFISFNEMSNKVLHSRKYHLYNRRRATKAFLQSFTHKENAYAVIVYPLFAKESNFFNEIDIDSKKSLELNMEYAKDGLKIYRIFVIEESNQITTYIKDKLQFFIESGIDVKLVLLKDIQGLVTSYDFIYGTDEDVVLYRESQDRLAHYKINKDKENIKVIMNDYSVIKSKSFSLEELE